MNEEKRDIADFVPKSWFEDLEKSSFWVTGYQVFYPEELELECVHSFDFEQARVLILTGEINYPKVTCAPLLRAKEGTVFVEEMKYASIAAKSTWLLILQPYIVDGQEKDEYSVKRKAGSIAALYAAINGFNMVYARVFDFHSTMNGRVSCSSPTFINPRAFPLPDLSQGRLQGIYEIGKAIDNLKGSEKRRVEIALHWFESGLRSLGLDAFVKYWVAIETLSMPDGTNIKPLNQRLAGIYNLSLEEATKKFGMGRVQDLRSRILHNGEDLTIHQDLSRYMEALFFDILLSCLNIFS
ncbi:MAG TPA: HEPN domain-containing protein, partial [Alphaproteobacteria bacterium]|nr:HEPN domain-containing protein [Alphaproteobacteria bacterium]